MIPIYSSYLECMLPGVYVTDGLDFSALIQFSGLDDSEDCDSLLITG